MNDNSARILNMIMYYVAAPALVVEFFLIDFGVIAFRNPIHLITIAVLLILVVITSFYKKNHPDFDYKVNDIYEKAIFVLILVEVFFINMK